VPAILSHTTLTASDFPASLAFYDAALAALGLSRVAEFGDEEEDEPDLEAAGWGTEDGAATFWLVAGQRVTRGAHVSWRVETRAAVEEFHAAALANGGSEHAAPRRWAIYRRGDFIASVLDPDGNLIEAVSGE
jgi:catechol 2,3-dioxygenase-like lactoylglutathione lyase family enzyme